MVKISIIEVWKAIASLKLINPPEVPIYTMGTLNSIKMNGVSYCPNYSLGLKVCKCQKLESRNTNFDI